ncbi:universal stress protein [Compostibacter hankyongensis]|uniref:Universal stress protein n=1 Tax=Compostibacter hankyongensis TaxID=1007089 RepID=A0ABP8FU56_9BACT
MRTFIVPTDFSINAQHASSYAVQLAATLDARIVLMHAYEEPVAISDYELSTIHFDTMKAHVLQRLNERKQELHATYGDKVPISCVTVNNNLVPHIQKLYESHDARLVIIGLTGAGMANIFLGSNTLNLVNNIGHPVVVVPPLAVFRPIRKVVFACDMKNVAATVPAEKMKRILQVVNAELLVLNIQHPKQPSPEMEAEKETLQKMLEGIPYSFHCVHKRNIIAGIKDFVREQQADMIVIIPKKRDFLENLIRPSHTKAMLFRSTIPIITIPLDEE